MVAGAAAVPGDHWGQMASGGGVNIGDTPRTSASGYCSFVSNKRGRPVSNRCSTHRHVLRNCQALSLHSIRQCRDSLHSPATLQGKFKNSRDWWPAPRRVVAWWPTLSSPSKSCTLSEHLNSLTPDSISRRRPCCSH